MESIQKKQVTIRNQKGEKIVCDVIAAFEDEEEKKNYICYTDYSSDANGQTKVYVSIYDPDSEDTELTPIEDENELKAVEDILKDAFQEEIKDREKSGGNFGTEIEEEENGFDYNELGMKAYAAKNYVLAEKAYLNALKIEDDINIRNNLAYLIRRREVADAGQYSEKDIVALLREGTKKKDIFSTINMALFWALNVGGEEDWQLADQLIANLGDNGYEDAVAWWKKIAENGEAEGYLVHLFLIRHGKIKESSLGSSDFLYRMVQRQYRRIPPYMMRRYRAWAE